MYGHGHGSYLEEIMLMKCLITSVCLLVDLADLCTVSHANFVLDMMQYLLYFVDTVFRLPELVD